MKYLIAMTYYSKTKDIPEYITALSRKNRTNPTKWEEILWDAISGKKIDGVKFRRQFPLGRYIIDFYSHSQKIAIEIDGEIHKQKIEYDTYRDKYIKSNGIKVLRFTNDEVKKNLKDVIERIRKEFTNKM